MCISQQHIHVTNTTCLTESAIVTWICRICIIQIMVEPINVLLYAETLNGLKLSVDARGCNGMYA